MKVYLGLIIVLTCSGVFADVEWCFPVTTDNKLDESVVLLPNTKYPREKSVSNNPNAVYVKNGYTTVATNFQRVCPSSIWIHPNNDVNNYNYIQYDYESKDFPDCNYVEKNTNKKFACKIEM